MLTLFLVPGNKNRINRRSECPLNASVEVLGDRWSLLIIRDMMLRGFRTFKEFLQSDEESPQTYWRTACAIWKPTESSAQSKILRIAGK